MILLPHDAPRVEVDPGEMQAWSRAERARRVNINAQDFERFVGKVTDGKHFRARQRLYASDEYFSAEPFFAAQHLADWQHTPAVLRQFAGAVGAHFRRWNIPVCCSEASAFHVRLNHTRYPELTRQEWQMFGFVGSSIADKLALPVEWAGFSLWEIPHIGPPPQHLPHLVERWSLSGLRRFYPAQMKVKSS